MSVDTSELKPDIEKTYKPLVEKTSEYVDKFMDFFLPRVPEEDRALFNCLMRSSNVTFAGGMYRSLINKEKPNDLDVFFLCREVKDFFKDLILNAKVSCLYKVTSNNNISIKVGTDTYSFMTNDSYKNAGELLETFDFSFNAHYCTWDLASCKFNILTERRCGVTIDSPGSISKVFRMHRFLNEGFMIPQQDMGALFAASLLDLNINTNQRSLKELYCNVAFSTFYSDNSKVNTTDIFIISNSTKYVDFDAIYPNTPKKQRELEELTRLVNESYRDNDREGTIPEYGIPEYGNSRTYPRANIPPVVPAPRPVRNVQSVTIDPARRGTSAYTTAGSFLVSDERLDVYNPAAAPPVNVEVHTSELAESPYQVWLHRFNQERQLNRERQRDQEVQMQNLLNIESARNTARTVSIGNAVVPVGELSEGQLRAAMDLAEESDF